MQSFSRVVLPIVIVIALVGGLSYFLQYTPPPPKDDKVASQIDAPSLLINQSKAIWDPADEYYQQEFEQGTKGGIYDFLVANPHPVPATMLLRYSSCTCFTVELGVVQADVAAAALSRLDPKTIAQPVKEFPEGLKPAELMDRIEWHPMRVNEATVSLPAADPKFWLRLGIVRFKFDLKNVGPLTLKATLNVAGGDPKPTEKTLDVPLVTVAPVQIQPPLVQLGDVKAGETRPLSFALWTSTRDSFPMDMPKLNDDACFVFGEPKALSAAECRGLEQQLRAEPNQPPTRVRAAYIVPVTVHESINDQQLELGPLNRRLVFNRGTPYEAAAMITGSVRGELRIAGAEAEERINLGEFRGDRPFSKVVIVNALRPDLKLKLVSASPEALHATLKERKGLSGGYELRLEIPANAQAGPLPAGSSVVLEIAGAKPRRIRIPVSGIAFEP